jgi:hypothetical protein
LGLPDFFAGTKKGHLKLYFNLRQPLFHVCMQRNIHEKIQKRCPLHGYVHEKSYLCMKFFAKYEN